MVDHMLLHLRNARSILAPKSNKNVARCDDMPFVTSALRRPRQEDEEFKTNLSYTSLVYEALSQSYI